MGTSDPRQTRFDRQTVLVVGLGKSGIASAAVLRERGASVVATVDEPSARLREEIAAAHAHGARFVPANELGAVLAETAFAVLSPGIPASSPAVTVVREAGIPAIGEVELAWRLCAAPMIAVTGTKGKSTTTALIAHLLNAGGIDARSGGNIGEPLVNVALAAPPSAWVVAELSSFQLETIVDLRPRISVLLNVTPDHLDRYASMDEYARAKFRVFVNQGAGDAIVLDRDDARLAPLEAEFRDRRCEAERLWYTLQPSSPQTAMALDGSAIVYTPRKGARVAVAERAGLPLAGAHNVRNVMAASLVALRVGCDAVALRDAIYRFKSLPHRLERVAEIDGVLYVDDSKATNPAAAAAALRSFERPVVLIAGGQAKGTDFSELGDAMRENARAAVGIGESAHVVAELARGIPYAPASSIEEAVERARDFAQRGDAVLLAPACASFDMFRSAEDRGERFVRAVHALGERARA